MKATIDAAVRTVAEVRSEFRSDRIIPAGTSGRVLEAYESPREGYAVELKLGEDDFEVVTLYPEQFEILDSA